MADLTADAPLRIWGNAYTENWVLDNSANQTVYKGQPMIIDQSEDTLNVRGFVDATTVAATDVFIGIAAGGAEVKTTDNEDDNEVEVYVEPTIVGFKSSVYTNADCGATVYMSDSGTLSATVGDNPQIGKLHRVEDGYAYVRLVSPQICTGA